MASWISPRPSNTSGVFGPAPAADGAQFDAVDALVSRLGGGLECQRLADAAIDACGHMQNLRDATIGKRQRASSALSKAAKLAGEAKPCTEIGRVYIKEQKEEETGLLYLERYLYLIMLAEYFRVYIKEQKEEETGLLYL